MSPENTETLQKGHESPPFQGDISYYGHPRSFSAQSLELKYTNNGKPTNTDSESDVAINYEKVALTSECCARAAWSDYYNFWAAVYPNLLKAQPLPHDGWVYPSSHGYYTGSRWYPQLPVQMVVPQSYHPEYNIQEFQYFVVIDFEATCDKERNPHPQEIIEFPSVLVNSRTGQLENSFQVYVRPTHNQQLTDFCKDLTGIQQSQVDKGVLLGEALLMHDKWLEDKGVKHTNFAVVTWSNWDCRVMLESECRFKRIRKPPYFNRWINLKIPYAKAFGDSRCNLRDAVERAGLTWEGRAHCGLDDAKNTARLLAHLMACGSKLSITNNLQWQSADHPTVVPAYQATPYKWKTPAYFTTAIPQQTGPIQEPYLYCYCGALSVKRVCQKPGPEKGGLFFGCGAAKGPCCSFIKWAAATGTVAEPVKAG
ncbi:uncharacterized protein LOC141646641 [Silene latifolia]|uniref:uncharacterized protein LOC141646641 n=1 Tax=Silene latifolia TaxID=37657 RepID=UPI003D76ABE0